MMGILILGTKIKGEFPLSKKKVRIRRIYHYQLTIPTLQTILYNVNYRQTGKVLWDFSNKVNAPDRVSDFRR